MKEFADKNFKVAENGEKFSRSVEDTEERRNCWLQAISPFHTVFSKDMYTRHTKTRAFLGKGSD